MRPVFNSQQQCIKSLQIDIHRKSTYSGRYLHFRSSHPLKLKRAVVRGLWLRAERLLASFPKQRQSEIAFLKCSFCRQTNGYPRRLINKWFAQFFQEL